MDRLLPNVNVVPSRFLFPLGLPYPNGFCNQIGYDIDLQINPIGIGWFLLPLPLKNSTCEFPHILLKWLWFEEARPEKPPSEKALEVRASGERNESFVLGKRFAVVSLLLAYRLEPSFDCDCLSLLGGFFRHSRSKSAPAKIS